ncbi:MFS transporter [Candidatus Woesebacteria bacterium]|nr:MFS transporter [Candidatus Woesebacteria bacterium]
MKIKNWLDKVFPLWGISNIRLFYVLTSLNNLWFLSGNWIFYWLRFMNYGQLGVMDAICFLFGLVMEVPSGAIADMIGKRKTIIVGMFLASAGFLTMGSANALPALWIGFLLAQAGWAFYSGAAEALAYDTLVDKGQEDHFDEVISTSGSLATITTVLAILAGGIMYVLHFRSTHLGMGVGYFLAMLFAFKLIEPNTDSEKFEISKWWATLVDGSRQLFLPALKPFVIIILVLMGSEYMYEWGLLKPAVATSFGFMDKGQAIIFACLGIFNSILVRSLPKIRNFISDTNGLYLLTIVMGLGFLLAAMPLKFYGLIPMLLIAVSGYLVYPWISIVVNKEIDPKHRATALSTVALITKIPYVLLAMIAGSMIEGGQLWVFNLILGFVIVGSMGINMLVARSKR